MPPSWGNRRQARVLDKKTSRRLWDLLAACRVGPESQWEGGVHFLVLRFRGGMVAQLSPTESGRLTYEDNSRFVYRRSIKIFNPKLHEAHMGMGKEVEAGANRAR